jgi:DNA-binding CsgD family transcriptional regulator
MAKSSIERLTARHRDCLNLVALNYSTKEIAIELALSPNTVDGYISEARDILSAPSRRDAARIFRDNFEELTPQKLGGDFLRVAANDESSSKPDGEAGDVPHDAVLPALGLISIPVSKPFQDGAFHWFRGEREHNSLSLKQRLLWIAAASIVASFMFLASLNIIDTLARLLSH